MQLPEIDYTPTVGTAIRRAARLFGETDFVISPNARLSFVQAEAASRRVARVLAARGISKGTRVAMHITNSPEWMIAFLAVTRMGAVAIPLSTALKPAELRKALRHSDAHTLISPASLFGPDPVNGDDHVAFVERALSRLTDIKTQPLYITQAPFLRSVLVFGTDNVPSWAEPLSLAVEGEAGADTVSEAFFEAMESEVTPADWVMIVYTSGTTAEPKGVIHTHGNYVRHNHNLSRFIGVDPSYRTYAGMPWFWIGGLGLGVGNAIARGFPLICVPKYEPRAVLDIIKAEKPVHIAMWGQLLQRFKEYVASSGVEVSDVPALATPPSGPVDMGLRHNSLGQTESFGPHTHAGPEGARVLPEELRGSFGLPVPCVQHRIVDPETLEDLPPGVDGELLVRGYSILHGLYKREKFEAFTDDGWLRTGDKCHFHDGYLIFKGRVTEMIKTSGSNVAPREVELTLEAYPEVALAVVLGIPDERRGETVGVVLVPAPGKAVDPATIKARALEELSNYKVPHRYLVLEDDELPVLGNGKPDKLKLRELLATAPEI